MFIGTIQKTALAMLISGVMAGSAYAKPEVLADFHGEMGSCDTCHVSDKGGVTNDNLTHENAQC
ncbi:MAG: flavocytochrome c, partial [Shewanella sp.]